jgi:hypothetical protein
MPTKNQKAAPPTKGIRVNPNPNESQQNLWMIQPDETGLDGYDEKWARGCVARRSRIDPDMLPQMPV